MTSSSAHSTPSGMSSASTVRTASTEKAAAAAVVARASRRLPWMIGSNRASNSIRNAVICPPTRSSSIPSGPATTSGTTGWRRRHSRLTAATSISATETASGQGRPSLRNPVFEIPETASTIAVTAYSSTMRTSRLSIRGRGAGGSGSAEGHASTSPVSARLVSAGLISAGRDCAGLAAVERAGEGMTSSVVGGERDHAGPGRLRTFGGRPRPARPTG